MFTSTNADRNIRLSPEKQVSFGVTPVFQKMHQLRMQLPAAVGQKRVESPHFSGNYRAISSRDRSE